MYEEQVQRRNGGGRIHSWEQAFDGPSSENGNNSPLWRHCVEEHNGELQEFQMSVTGTFKNDAMLRQITEAVQIERTETGTLMNDRAEWNMTRVPRTVISVT